MERTESERFAAKVKSIRKQIRAFAASTEGDDSVAHRKIRNAIEKAYDLARFVDDGCDIIGGLIAARRFAALESQARVRAERDAEIARLDREIRERNASMGGYEKELALMRLRGGR